MKCLSHLTIGQYKNCRIPVVRPLTPSQFITFILRNFYHTAYNKYCQKLTQYNFSFDATITKSEQKSSRSNALHTTSLIDKERFDSYSFFSD